MARANAPVSDFNWLASNCGKRSRIGSETRLATSSSTTPFTSTAWGSPSVGRTIRLPASFTSK